jgi:hypothetical protein
MFFNRVPLYAPDAGGADGDPPGEPPADGGEDKPKSFSQKDVDALMGKTRKEAREATLGGLLKELGLESVDALKTGFTEARQLKEAQMSETEKQKAALEQAQAQVKEAQSKMQASLQLANERLMRAAVMAEASKAEYKLNPAALGDVWLFLDKTKLEMAEDGEVKGLPEAVKAVLEAKPYLQQNGRATGPEPTPKPDGSKELTDEERRKKAAAVRDYW